MMGTTLLLIVYFQSCSGTSTNPSGTLSKKSSELSTCCPLTPMVASTLYSVDVNLPTFFTNFWLARSSISLLVNELVRPLMVLAVPMRLLTMR